VQLAGAEDKVATMTMNDCIISNFNEALQVSVDVNIKMERKLTLTSFTIENCKVVIKAKGPQASPEQIDGHTSCCHSFSGVACVTGRGNQVTISFTQLRVGIVADDRRFCARRKRSLGAHIAYFL